MSSRDGFQTTVCPHCKKEFVKAPQSVYGKYCSWKCCNAAYLEQEAGKKAGKENIEKTKTLQKKPRTRKTSACKSVLQYTMDGKFVARYDSISEASETVGVSISCISGVCRGGAKQTKGFVFAYGDKVRKTRGGTSRNDQKGI